MAEREPVVEELAVHRRACRNALKVAQENRVMDRKRAKRLLSGFEGKDANLFIERATLTKNRVKLEYDILSHPMHARIGEACLAKLVENLFEPAGARDKYDQQRFKVVVSNSYTPIQGTLRYDAPSLDPKIFWCPVTRSWHDTFIMKTAHIVPYGIGEFNAAYIFGLPLDQGWEAMWDFKNGLVLHRIIKEALDNPQVVIVPDA